MSLLAFHFSNRYKEKLLNGSKQHTIVDYSLELPTGTKILIFVSAKGNIEDSDKAIKLGEAIVKRVLIKKISKLTDKDAKKFKHDSKRELIESLSKWYDLDQTKTLTYIEFKLSL